MTSVSVRPVLGRRDLNAFIKLPFRLHRGTPWVPPLIFERRQEEFRKRTGRWISRDLVAHAADDLHAAGKAKVRVYVAAENTRTLLPGVTRPTHCPIYPPCPIWGAP